MSHRAVLELAATGTCGSGISEPGEGTETPADRRAGRLILIVAGLAVAAVPAEGLAPPASAHGGGAGGWWPAGAR